MNESKMKELMNRLKQYDTPTVTNVIATYPSKEDKCLGLYDPWTVNWYTDERMRCIFQGLGSRVGFAVTCIYGMKDPNFKRLDFSDVLGELNNSFKPTILVVKQDFPESIRCKNGLMGGNMVTALKRVGCVGVVSDGPSRDIHEIREMDFQMLLTGISPGHGDFSVKAVNVPVSVCSMDVSPGEIIHMDENGACKFPASKLQDVVELCERLVKFERKQMDIMDNTKDVNHVGEIMKNYGV